MKEQAGLQVEAPLALPEYDSVLVAADSSDHANRATTEAVDIASLWNSAVSGTHVYAAKMHDARFRQMEGGLPEKYREEQELEHQREVHDSLITRGLSIITDSYLDQAQQICERANLRFARRSLEGKNYRALVDETNSGNYDLLVLGALGLGSIDGSRLGTVCQRVVRRAEIDTLVIKDPQRRLAGGPIAVAIDGSPKAYGALLTALSLAHHWQTPVHVIAAFDPYYHYVAFNRIAGILSEEAGKVFRFKEQEQLHEDIIDSGLAKIYKGHLTIAEAIANDFGVAIETTLVDGKPHDAIEKHLQKLDPSLLVVGKLGIHADPDLDIGGNAENLLRNVDCAVLLGQREYHPRIETVADATITWTEEAEKRMERVPSFVQGMARMAILRYAQERGHTVVTESIVEEATAELMPGHAEQAMESIVAAYDAGELKTREVFDPMPWSDAAKALLETVDEDSVRRNLQMRAEKKARAEAAERVEPGHLESFLSAQTARSQEAAAVTETQTAPDKAGLHWHAAALARLMRVPEGFMRDASRERVENYAAAKGIAEISLLVVEEGLTQARKAMEGMMAAAPTATTPSTDRAAKPSACPFAKLGEPLVDEGAVDWTAGATALLDEVPEGFCRDMTRKAVNAIIAQNGASRVDEAAVEQVMHTFKDGAQAATQTMAWEPGTKERIERAPEMVRGMLMTEIESWARRHGVDKVGHSEVDAVKSEWQERGVFHLDPNDPRGKP